jgi:hypothetical protein
MTNTENLTNNDDHQKRSEAAHRAIETIRGQGADRERTEFIRGRDEELRALMDKNLPHGAVRLFCLLFKLSWLPQCGGFYTGIKGAIAIAGKKLARMARANPKSFYRSMKNGRVTPGWIDLLVQGGYVWITKHKIPNIPEDKWLNVYHISVLHAPGVQQSLPWADGNWGGEVAIEHEEGSSTGNGSRDFSAQNGSTTAQVPQNGHGTHRNGDLATTENGSCPIPATPVRNYRNGHLASGVNGTRKAPKTVAANGGKRHLASGGNGSGQEAQPVLNRKTEVGESTSRDPLGEDSPPVDSLDKWKKQIGWGKIVRFQREFEKLECRCVERMMKATTPEAKQEWKQRLAAVREQLDGGSVAEPAPKSKRVVALPNTSAKPEKLNAREAELAEGYARRLKVKVAA